VWIVRELLRLVGRIAVAVLVAILIAEVRAIITGGDTMHTFRIVLLLMGCVLLLLAAGGQGTMAGKKLNHDGWWLTRAFGAFGAQTHPEDPTLSPGAVFIGSGLAVLALGLFI
jgi:hypothetical protein